MGASSTRHSSALSRRCGSRAHAAGPGRQAARGAARRRRGHGKPGQSRFPSSVPVAKPSPAASKMLVDDPLDPLDLDALPLRAPSPAVRAPTTTSYGLLIVLLSAVVGWLAYLAVDRGPGSLPFQRRPTAASARVKSSPVEAVQTAGSGPVLETAAELPPLATATPTTGPTGRPGRFQHPDIHGTSRVDRDNPIHAALLRGQRCPPGTHRAWRRRRPPDEHAELPSSRSPADNDLRAHRVRSRWPAREAAARGRRQVSYGAKTQIAAPPLSGGPDVSPLFLRNAL